MIELAGNENGAAHVKAELIEAERSRGLRKARVVAAVARPGVGVERRIAEVFNRVAVEVLGTALGHEADLASRRASVLSRVVGRQDLHLLNRIHVLRSEDRAG